MKSSAIVVAAAWALPLAVAAQDMPMPKMFKGMEKGQWQVDILERHKSGSGTD